MTIDLDVGRSALLTDLAMCVNHYRLASPGLYCCVHAPLELDEGPLLRPGVLAMANHGRHKQCRPEPDYEVFRGPPNFVLDVFPADDWLDYAELRARYEQAGVIEYVAVRDTQPTEWVWNRRVDGVFAEVKADHEQLILSEALPGFWVPRHALAARDWWTIMAATTRGVTRRAHHEYMDAIWRPDSANESDRT